MSVSIPLRGLHPFRRLSVIIDSLFERVGFLPKYYHEIYSIVKVLKLRAGGIFSTIFSGWLKHYGYLLFSVIP